MAALVLLLVALGQISFAAEDIVGVAPENLDKYKPVVQGTLFLCLDGSEHIHYLAVNDNYCDCADGSDEPSTGACAGLPGAHFYCRNELASPKLLYASRVHDGICDCCDGSDELQGRCPNGCEAQGAAERIAREKRRALLVEGLRILDSSENEARKAIVDWEAQATELAAQLPELQKRKEAAELAFREAKAAVTGSFANVSEEDSGGQQLFGEDFEASGVFERWNRAEGGSARVIADPADIRGQVLAFDGCTWGGDVFSREGVSCSLSSPCMISFWSKGAPWQGFSCGAKRTEEELVDAHSWLAVPASNADFPDREHTVSLEIPDSWTHHEYEFPTRDAFQMFGSRDVTMSTCDLHIMLQAHGSTGHCSSTMLDGIEVWKVESEVSYVDTDGDLVEFKLASSGRLDAYSDGKVVATNMKSLETESDGSVLTFGKFKSTPKGLPSEAKKVTERVLRLFRRSTRISSSKGQASAVAEGSEVSEYAKWALDQQGDDSADDEDEAEEEEIERDGDEEEDEGEEDFVPATRVGPEFKNNPEVKAAASSLDGIRNEIARAEKQRSSLRKKLAQVKSEPGLVSLVDQCVSKEIGEHNYEVCFFAGSKQGHTSLGQFGGWDESGGAMLFENGQMCYGGPARSLKVHMDCGSEQELLDVEEPSRCVYEAWVRAPAGCKKEDLRLLDEGQAAPRPPHEEL